MEVVTQMYQSRVSSEYATQERISKERRKFVVVTVVPNPSTLFSAFKVQMFNIFMQVFAIIVLHGGMLALVMWWTSRHVLHLILLALIMWRTSRNVFIVRWNLVIPTQTHASPLCHIQIELRPQHSRRASRSCVLRFLITAPLLRDNEFQNEVMADLRSRRSLHIALRFLRRIDRALEFRLDITVVEIRLPALFELGPTDLTLVCMFKTFTLAADFVGVFRTGDTDGGFVLFDAPSKLSQTPPDGRVLAFGCYP